MKILEDLQVIKKEITKLMEGKNEETQMELLKIINQINKIIREYEESN